MEEGKNNIWQLFRGIAIAAVVACHCPGFFSVEEDCFNYSFYLLIRQLTSFGVPLFLFIAGYFVNLNEFDTKKFIKKRIKRLLFPYLIWTSIYTIVNVVQNSLHHIEISTKEILFDYYLMGGATAPLYYIIVLLQLTFLTPLLGTLINKKSGAFIWIVTPIYLLLMYMSNIILGHYPEHYNVPFLGWIWFYWLGLNVRNNRSYDFKRISEYIVKKRLCVWMCLFCIIESTFITLLGGQGQFAMAQMKLSSMVWSTTLCFLVFYMAINHFDIRNKFSLFLVEMGNCSYGIFFVHELVKKVPLFLFARIGFEKNMGYFFCCWLITLLLSTIIVYWYRFFSVNFFKRMKNGGWRSTHS